MTQFTHAKIIRGLRNPALAGYHLRHWFGSLKHGLKGTLADPKTVKLYVNNHCNCHCTMCDFGTRDSGSMFYQQVKPGEKINMTDSLFEKLLQEISVFRPRICIAGVEPLLHPEIIRFVSMLTRQKLLVSLITNGRLLAGHAEELVATGLENITVSIDGTEDIHDLIRGRGTWNLAMQGLVELKRNRVKGTRPTITVGCTISASNQHNLEENAHALFRDNLIDRITFHLPYVVTPAASLLFNCRFRRLGESTPANNGAAIDDIDAATVWRQITWLFKKYGSQKVQLTGRISSLHELDRYFHEPGRPLGKRQCSLPWQSMTILAHGEAVIDNRCLRYVAGNLNEASLQEIWHGAAYNRFRTQLKTAGSFPICLRCTGTIRK